MPDPQDDDPQDEPEEDAHDLVMPFVTVASKGGPHDDDAYAAGWQCGAIDARLQLCAAAGAVPLPVVAQTVNLPQIDLIAMRHGYTVAHDPDPEVPEWSHVTFRFPDGASPDLAESPQTVTRHRPRERSGDRHPGTERTPVPYPEQQTLTEHGQPLTGPPSGAFPEPPPMPAARRPWFRPWVTPVFYGAAAAVVIIAAIAAAQFIGVTL